MKNSMRSDRRKWTDSLIEEVEKAASNGRMNTYGITRTLSNDKKRTPPVIEDKDGNIFSGEEDV